MLITGPRRMLSQIAVGEERIQRLGDVRLRLETIDDLSDACFFELEAVQKLFDVRR